jgi:hypothetical protein
MPRRLENKSALNHPGNAAVKTLTLEKFETLALKFVSI